MKNVKTFFPLIVSLCICTAVSAQTKTPAFPEAQGFGAFTKGGRGGQVFIVTTTEDYGENEPVIKGSFREAIEAAMPRTVVFEVSGIIELKRPLVINDPYITIAGQTAPGGGICLKDYSFSVRADEAIVRYLRVRVGDVHRLETDAIDIGSVVDNSGQLSDIPSSNVIVDHCSAGWATDEIFTIGSERSTVQWSIISECLYKSFHPKGSHSMGSVIRGSSGGISMLHNIYVHNNSRNPKFGSDGVSPGAVFDLRNNIFYNWGRMPGYSNNDEHVRINLVGNFYKPGPSSRENLAIAFKVGGILNSIHVADNHHTNNPEAAKDNWLLIESGDGKINKRSTPFPHPPMEKKTGNEIYEAVLNGAGAVLPERDPVDERIINEIRTGKGSIINSQQDVGGWPVYKSTKAPVDKDRDGMADKWEATHGLKSADPSDHKNDLDNDGYTNLEEYINGTDPNEATSSLQDYAEFKAALDEIEVLNVQGYAEAKAYEAAHLEALSKIPEPNVTVSFSKRPDAKVKNLTVMLNDSVKIEMILVEPGTFMMGSPDDEPGRFADEKQHEVTISKPYYLAATEMTTKQYYEVMTKAYERKFVATVENDNSPASAAFPNAVKYMEVLSNQSGYKFRLPTEAEWEYACRAGTTTPNFTGKSITRDYANYDTREPGLELGSNDVDQNLPNPWGFYNMPGNKFEWCSDFLADYPSGPVTDPTGPTLGSGNGININSRRVLRGGTSGSSWEFVRSAARYGYKPRVGNAMRIVLEVEKPLKPKNPMPGVLDQTAPGSLVHGYKVGKLLNQDDFDGDLSAWQVEQMPGGTTVIKESAMEIDDAKGCTIWFREKMDASVLIEYDITMIDHGGPHDRTSDLNCFAMAIDPKNPDDLLAGGETRGGSFKNYHPLRLYYVGYGANKNQTARFRRYPGGGARPVLPQHDLKASHIPNQVRRVQIISGKGEYKYLIDGELVFDIKDPEPFTSGWFGFRTVRNHMKIDRFRVWRVVKEK